MNKAMMCFFAEPRYFHGEMLFLTCFREVIIKLRPTSMKLSWNMKVYIQYI